MTVSELTNDQLEELKQDYLCQHFDEVENRSPSYDELSNAAETVSDSTIFDAYGGTEFSNDDFACTAEIPQF
ncbi:MAG: hypothetical protein RR235_10035 [Oscillospiraceae bacterium]